ncbi:MAG: type II toxin-antitoxin system YoeB family toxin [Planctomycetes bacterium]|nr:type II toxin-antitoxin system YoeB family toxin [Planctomycetota bacterium]
MNLTFTPSGWNNYQWFVQHDRRLLTRINELICRTIPISYSRSTVFVLVLSKSIFHRLLGQFSRP